MREIAVSELRLGDIGARVIVIDTAGNAYDGKLSDVTATDWPFATKPNEMVRSRIAVKSDERSELKLTNLPLDFRLQIEPPDQQEGQQ